MWWRYLLAAALVIGGPLVVYGVAKSMSEALPLPLFIGLVVAFGFGVYKLACWMDRAGWKP
jgi:hypothetical protein